MAIIKKRADELKPGDVCQIMSARYAILAVLPDDNGPMIEITSCGICEGAQAGMRERNYHRPEKLFDIEAPDLTPAQQHAEELLDLVRKMAGVLKYKHSMTDIDFVAHSMANVELAHELLAKIDPPAPPTLAEALASLEALTPNANGDPEVDIAIKLLDRARRANLLK